jgi:hypothetical protein
MKGNTGKKRKVGPPKNGKGVVKAKGKERAFERPTIPIPGADNGDNEGEDELSEEDFAFYGENGGGEFLVSLDKNGISRCVLTDHCCLPANSVGSIIGARRRLRDFTSLENPLESPNILKTSSRPYTQTAKMARSGVLGSRTTRMHSQTTISKSQTQNLSTPNPTDLKSAHATNQTWTKNSHMN